jgi:hypothetical protein
MYDYGGVEARGPHLSLVCIMVSARTSTGRHKLSWCTASIGRPANLGAYMDTDSYRVQSMIMDPNLMPRETFTMPPSNYSFARVSRVKKQILGPVSVSSETDPRNHRSTALALEMAAICLSGSRLILALPHVQPQMASVPCENEWIGVLVTNLHLRVFWKNWKNQSLLVWFGAQKLHF